ncbi:MAG: DUF3144 domain-containing protein [Sedimenticola sp.]
MQESDFYEVADQFIHFANELSEEWALPFLSAVFMYAAARYNTFFFYEADGEHKNKEEALDYYSDQYRKMMQQCMQEMG